MGFTVDPDLLLAAAKETRTAAGELAGAQAAARKAEEHASAVHYQPAAGMAEAVAQKAAASLSLMHAALTGLGTGLATAADAYQRTDTLGVGPRPGGR